MPNVKALLLMSRWERGLPPTARYAYFPYGQPDGAPPWRAYCGALRGSCQGRGVAPVVQAKPWGREVLDCTRCPFYHTVALSSDGALGQIMDTMPAWLREAIREASNARHPDSPRAWCAERALRTIPDAARAHHDDDPLLADAAAAFFGRVHEYGDLYSALLACWLAHHHRVEARAFFARFIRDEACWRLLAAAFLDESTGEEHLADSAAPGR